MDGIAPLAAYGLGLLSALLLFASILLHELGHAVVARRNGVEIEEIDLWLLGGVARMAGYPKTAAAELRFAIAGPAVTLLIAAIFVRDRGCRCRPRPRSPCAPSSTTRPFVNLAILVFNLLPAFPLDGGRVARALIWGRIGDVERATAIAASIGRGFGFGMIALGSSAPLRGRLWRPLAGTDRPLRDRRRQGRAAGPPRSRRPHGS